MSIYWKAILLVPVVVLALLGVKGFLPPDASHMWRHRPRSRLLPANSHDLTTINSVLSSPTGPDDFAAMGTAVNLTLCLLDAIPPLGTFELTRQLRSALLHLFPFVKPCLELIVTGLQTRTDPPRHAHTNRGIVIPCGNANFQFAMHLIAAGELPV